MNVDLLLTNAAQIATCAGPTGPKRQTEMRNVGLLENGAVAATKGKIVAVGPSAQLQAAHSAETVIDVQGKSIVPGFVDAHTHAVYAGDRVGEFEQRIAGASYMEIMAAGGGILSTMAAVRQAGVNGLVEASRPRLAAMLRLGTTTAEIKTGYGLSLAAEMDMLQAIDVLHQSQPVDIVPTFLAAHAIPPEDKADPDGYVSRVIDEMLPAAQAWYRQSLFARQKWPFFNDDFCEQNAFSLAQSRRLLTAGLTHGMPAKIHADEFTALGGVSLAVELQATSVDHLDVTSPPERNRLAASDTVGVLLPAVNFNLGSHHFANARALIDAGAAVALATDINPGSAPCPSMPLVMALACRYQKLLPAEALNAATLNAAHAVGLGHQIGSIEVGKQADLLVIDAPDYRHLAYQFGINLVEMVIKRGQIV